MLHPIEPSTMRILNAKGQTIGTGFLVSKTLAVTCAHVAIAAGMDGESRIRAQFTGQKQPIVYAKVLDEFLDLDRDIAILQLESVPEGVQPLRLGSAAQCQPGNLFYSFGYTSAAKVQGIIARGAIDGYLPQHQLLQLQAPQANHGISGAPVLDEKRGVVVGMITKGHNELGRNQETTFATPSELFFKICPEIQPDEICPYLGLESFSAETERFFFGRAALTEKLLTTLSRGCRFLAVFGPSGSGKSSVVRAGLLPALKKSQPSWAQIIIRPADDPFAQLTAAGLDLSNIPTTKTVLFIDQFEELFTCPDDIRESFVRELVAALENSNLILIIAMRDDFYSAFNAKAAPLAASSNKVVVDVPVTLERADLVAMIEQPAAAVGLVLEEGLTDAIIKDAAPDGSTRSSSLPLLEFALTQLWDKRRDGLLTHNTYQSIDGVIGSLARWADDAYSDLLKTDQPLAESLLTALVHLGDEGQGLPDTRRRRALTEFDEPTRRIIKHFADRRLFVTSGETVELVHDALVREWGRLQEWIKKDREQLRILEAVSETARIWSAAPKNADLLVHRGGRLDDALKLQNRMSVREQAYLKTCVEIREREKRNRERLRNWMMVGVSGTIFILFCVAIAITAIIVWGRTITVENNKIRLASQLEAASLSNQNYFDLAALLNLERLDTLDSLKGRGDLLSLLQTHSYLRQYLRGNKGDVTQIVYSRDGNTLISISSNADKALMFWNAHTGELLATLPQKNHGYLSMAISPDGHILATANTNIFLWDVTKRQLLGTLTKEGESQSIFSLAFSSDGKTLAAGTYSKVIGGVINRWDVSTHQQIGEPLTGHKDGVSSLAFSPNGQWLASGSWDNTIRLWDAGTGQLLGQPLEGHTYKVSALAFSSDSQILVSCDYGGAVRFWDVFSHQPEGKPVSIQTACASLAFNGQMLAVGGDKNIWFWNTNYPTTSSKTDHNTNNNLTWLWNTESRSLMNELLAGHRNVISGLAFSPDGKALASSSYGGDIILWNTTPGQTFYKILPVSGTRIAFSAKSQILAVASGKDEIVLIDPTTYQAHRKPLMQHATFISDMDFSVDGRTLAVAYDTNSIVLWDVTSGQQFGALLKKHRGVVTALAFSPTQNNILASAGSSDRNVVLWDTATSQPFGEPLIGHTNLVRSLVFSSNGKVLASSDNGGNVFLWSVPDGKRLDSISIDHPIYSVAFSRDNKILAIGTQGGDIILWDMEKHQQKGSSLTSHTNNITALIFGPDFKNNLLFSGSLDGTIRLWDAATGEQLGLPFQEHTGMVTSLSIVKNQKGQLLLASSDENQKVILWDIDFDSWRMKACSIAGRNLTETEWKQYVGDTKPYRRTCIP